MGSRHHYIPKMLLKGFASKSSQDNKKHWLWQFHIGRPPKEIGTTNVAVSEHYYGFDNILEDSFNRLENKWAPMIDKIRAGEDPNQFNNDLRLFFWMQSLRTKSIHDHFLEAVQNVIDEFGKSAKSIDLSERIADNVKQRFAELITSELMTLPLNQRIVLQEMTAVPAFQRLTLDAMIRKMVVLDVHTVLEKMIEAIGASGIIEETMQSGMRKSLQSILETAQAPESFRPTNWRTQQFENNSLILGDICAFGIGENNTVGSIQRYGLDWVHVLLPIAHNCLIVGSKTSDNIDLSSEGVNWASAGLSFDTIYASANTGDFGTLRNSIGSMEPLINSHEISAIVKKSWVPD